MSKFIRLTKTVNDRGILIPESEILKNIKNVEIDHYTSTYYYNDNHFKTFKETGTIKGIKDVFSTKIWWDFDGETLESPQKDALILLKRLQDAKIPSEAIELWFSGNKGFNVILNVNQELTPKQVQYIAVQKFGQGLSTLDTSLYDAPQLLRIPGTKHQVSGLYKIPITIKQLENLKIDKLKEKAAQKPIIDLKVNKIDLTPEFLTVPEEKAPVTPTNDLDLYSKPRQWKSSKWALMQGFIKPGERNQSAMILSATCKAMGYDLLTTYYMCKSALKKSWERYGEGNFDKKELFSIIERTFEKDNIGQYSEKDDPFLQKKAEELGIKELTTQNTVDIKGALRIYKDYAKNINKLTLKTGIKEIDERQRITVGMSFGIIAAPGVGKTSIALEMLYNMSKSGELCIFFSYDMYAPLIIQKIIQKHWKDGDIEQVFTEYENGNQEYVEKVEELIKVEYPNVEFCFESAQNIEEIYNTIHMVEQKKGKKCKFIVIDYNELVITDVSDPTQSSNFVAQKVRELASKEQLCVLSLFQPSKLTGDPSTEILSFRAAKGGSGIEQSVSLMFGISRPGFDPRKPADDKYVSINCVKNRMGPIFSADLYWDGYRGIVRSLSPEEKKGLSDLRQRKEDERLGKIMKIDEGWDSN